MRRLLMTAAMLALGCTAAQAADNGFYLGGSVGQSNIQSVDEVQNLQFDGTDTAYKIIAGFRPLDWLGVEANYVDLGNPDDTVANVPVQSDGSGFSAFAVGFLPVGPVDLFAKAGFIKWDASVSAPSLPALSLENDGSDFAYGAGVQFRVLSLTVRGEYEVFDIEDLDEVNLLSIGVMWTFL